MTKQKEVYLVVYQGGWGDCPLLHVAVFDSFKEAMRSMEQDYEEGTVSCVRGIKVAEREFSLFSEPADSA